MKVYYCTGYKSFELGIFKKDHEMSRYIKKAIKNELVLLLEEGLEWLITSGQLGIDLWAIEAAVDLRIEYPHMKVGVIEPFYGQSEKWSEQNQSWYNETLAKVDFTDAVFRKKYEGPYMFRKFNEFVLNKTDGALLVYDNEKEGSPQYFYRSAFKFSSTNQYDLRTISLNDLQQVVEDDQYEQD